MKRKAPNQSLEPSRTRRNVRTAPVEEDEPPRPSSDFNLSEEERALLADPDWVTEDDADTIISLRREKHDGRPIPLAEALKRRGFRLHNGRVVPIR